MKREIKKTVAYADVFIKGKQFLLVAFDGRHKELWRRNDPGAIQSAKGIRRWGKEIFYHHEP